MPDSFARLTNVPAERAALGAFIESPRILNSAVAEGLTADDFSVQDYQRVFRKLLEMEDKRFPVDSISLAEFLGNSQNDYVLVGDLVSGTVVTHDHILHHVRIVRQKSRLRSLLRLSDWIAQAVVEPCADPEQIAKLACEQLEPVSVSL